MNSFRPHLPGSLLAGPKLIQVLVFAIGVHGVKEPVMAIGHELALAGQALERFAFEDALRAVEVIEHAPVEDKVAGADQAVRLRLLHKALNPARGVSFEYTEARDGRN